MSVSLAITAVVRNIYLLVVFYGVSLGLGMIFVINPPAFLLDEYFPYQHRRHVLATSVIACAFPLGKYSNKILHYFIDTV